MNPYPSLNDDPLPDPPVTHVNPEHVDGLRAAIAAGELDRAEQHVRDHWLDLVLSLRRGVAEILGGVPESTLRSRPLLLMLLGMAYNLEPHLRPRGMRLFVGAALAARAARASRRLPQGDRILLLTAESSALRLVGRPALAARAARTALEILAVLPSSEREALAGLSRLYAHLGTSLFAAGKSADALDCFERGWAETARDTHSPGFLNLALLTGVHALEGNVRVAESYANIARRDPWTESQRSWYAGTFYRLGEAVLALERFDVRAAQEHLDAMVHDRRTIEHWRTIAAVEALVLLADGQPETALARMDGFFLLRGEEGRSHDHVAGLAGVRALLHLASGNTDAAQRMLRRFSGTDADRHIALARVSLARGRHGDALHAARLAAEASRSLRASTDAAAIEAACTVKIEGSRRRRSSITYLAEYLRSTGMRLPVALLPPDDYERVIAAMVEQGHTDITDTMPATSLLRFGAPTPELTERELSVLAAMRAHSSLTEVARELHLSVNTVKTHRRNIYRKLDASSRDDAIAIALDQHLLPPSPS